MACLTWLSISPPCRRSTGRLCFIFSSETVTAPLSPRCLTDWESSRWVGSPRLTLMQTANKIWPAWTIFSHQREGFKGRRGSLLHWDRATGLLVLITSRILLLLGGAQFFRAISTQTANWTLP